jgi:hypothetical protein
MQRENQIDLSDKKIFELVQRSDTTSPDKKIIPEVKVEEKEKIAVDYCKRESSITKFMKKLFILVFILLILYLTIFRYVLGYKFFKNKEYKKGAAILSPEILTISALLL